MKIKALSYFFVLLVLSFTACKEAENEDNTVYPAEYRILSGNKQLSELGKKQTEPLKVLALDGEGKPLKEVNIVWKIKSGGGTVTQSESITDLSGTAQTEWTLGSSGEQEVEASIKKKDGSLILEKSLTFVISKYLIDALAGKWYLGNKGIEFVRTPGNNSGIYKSLDKNTESGLAVGTSSDICHINNIDKTILFNMGIKIDGVNNYKTFAITNLTSTRLTLKPETSDGAVQSFTLIRE